MPVQKTINNRKRIISLKVTVENNLMICFSDTTLQSNKWYHIAGSYRVANGRARLYINGVLANEVTPVTTPKRSAVPAPNNSTHAPWKCANLGASKKEKPLQGIMDEFRIFKCELLPEEIMDLFSKNSVKRFRIPLPSYNWKKIKQVEVLGNVNRSKR